MPIFGTLHLQEHGGGNFLQPNKSQRDLARFDFSGKDVLETIGMLESVLATVKAKYEMEAEQKKIVLENQRLAKEKSDRIKEDQRQARINARNPVEEPIPPGYDPDDEEEDEDDDELPGPPRNAPRVP